MNPLAIQVPRAKGTGTSSLGQMGVRESRPTRSPSPFPRQRKGKRVPLEARG